MKYWKKIICGCLIAFLIISGLSVENQTTVQAATTDPFVIVLDPGHDEIHCRGANKISGVVEEDSNLAIAKALKKDLEKYGFTVCMTRTDSECPIADAGLTNKECMEYRVNYAKAAGCDLYVSVHLNACGGNDGVWKSGSGSGIFISNYSKYKSSLNALAVAIGEKLQSSCGISRHRSSGIIKKSTSGLVYDDGNTVDYYKVLRESTWQGFPSIIIEHLFMDNKKDVSILKKKGASALAAADCAAIVSWYKKQYGGLPASGTVGYVNNDTLNLRSSAGTSGKIVATLSKKDPVIIYGSKGSWYQVVAKHGGKSYKGYVKASYVKKGVPSVTYGSAQPKTSSSGSTSSAASSSGSTAAEGYVNYTFLNLRKAASTDAQIICRLDQNDTLKLYSSSGKWYKVDAVHNGKTYSGYVYSAYVAKGSAPASKKTSSGSAADGSYTTAGYVSYSYLNLRKEPSSSSEKIVQLTEYDTMMLGKKSNGWYPAKAVHNGKTYTGYVKADYVTTGHVGCVNYTYLNVRSAPGTKNKKIDELSKNDAVVITATKGSWYQIKYVSSGTVKTGYVLSSYISQK